MVPVGGVVVSSSGYSFRRAGLEAGRYVVSFGSCSARSSRARVLPYNSVILSIQNIKTPDLATFEQVITSFPHRTCQRQQRDHSLHDES